MRIQKINSLLFFLFFLLLPTQLGKHFFLDFSYVNGVRIDYLAPTLYLIDFVVVALMVVNWKVVWGSLVNALRFLTAFEMTKVSLRMTKGDAMTKRDMVTKWLGITVLALVGMNIVLAQEPIMALYMAVRYVEMWVVFVLVRNLYELRGLVKPLFIGVVIQFGLSIYQISAQHSAHGIFYWLGERAFSISTPGIATISLFDTIALRPYGTFSHPNSLGGFYALSYVFFLMSQLKLPRRIEIMRYGILLLSGFLVLMSFSKVAIGAVLLTTLYYVLRVLKINCRWCKWGRVFMLGIISLIFLSGKSDVASLDKRVALTQSSLHTIANYPFFGTGLGNSLYSQSVMSQQLPYFFLQPVHNIFLLFISEAGLLLSAVIALIAWREIKGKKKDDPSASLRVNKKRVLLSIIAVIVITGMLDHYWLTLIQNQLALAAFLGVGIGIKRATT